jgi:hypothetical protein
VHEVDADHPTDVATGDGAAVVAEHIVHERVHVARVHREVVDVGGRQIAVAVAAQVGDDDLEPGGGEWRDVAPPDPLGLRIAVEQEQWVSADALADVGEVQSVADDGAVDRELARRRRRGLRRPEARVVGHAISTSRRRRVSRSVLINHSPSTSS